MTTLPTVVPDNLPSLVASRFSNAKESQKLSYYPTEVAILQVNGIPFQLRFSPALAHKPKASPPPSETSSEPKSPKKPFDPFESPSSHLFICPIGTAHYLVLNKFAIIPEHFILATTQFKEQTHLLQENDFAAAWALLGAWKCDGDDASGAERELFGFFNSGEHSGASQRHRHLQFLPIEGMMRDVEVGRQVWRPLVDSMAGDTKLDLPFLYFAAVVPEKPTPCQLHEMYLKLYRRACRATGISKDSYEEKADGEANISYNMGLTNKAMVICPRRAEGLEIFGKGGKKGLVALNGTVLAGTLLVKNEMEWEALRSDKGGEKLSSILGAIGFPESGNGKL